MSVKIKAKGEELDGELYVGNKDMALTIITGLMEDFEITTTEIDQSR